MAIGLLLGLVGGVCWALIRPTYTVRFEDGKAIVDQASGASGVEFAAFGWLTVISAVVGVALALVALRQAQKGETSGGLAQLLWLIVAAGAAALTVYAMGEVVAHALHPIPSHHDGGEGAPFTVAPSIAPSVAPLVAPFVAALVFWVSASVADANEQAAGEAAEAAGPETTGADTTQPNTADEAPAEVSEPAASREGQRVAAPVANPEP